MRHLESQHDVRPAVYGTVATRLSLLSDRRLGEIVASAPAAGSGIGGRSAELDVDGTRVFVKRPPRRPRPGRHGKRRVPSGVDHWSQADAVPPEIATIIERHARASVVLNGFHRRLLSESKQTPFPGTELARVADPGEASR